MVEVLIGISTGRSLQFGSIMLSRSRESWCGGQCDRSHLEHSSLPHYSDSHRGGSTLQLVQVGAMQLLLPYNFQLRAVTSVTPGNSYKPAGWCWQMDLTWPCHSCYNSVKGQVPLRCLHPRLSGCMVTLRERERLLSPVTLFVAGGFRVATCVVSTTCPLSRDILVWESLMFLTEVTEATGLKYNKIIMPRSNFQTTICQPAHLFNSFWSVCVSGDMPCSPCSLEFSLLKMSI